MKSSNWNKYLQIVEEVSQDADLSFAAVFREGVVDRTTQMRCGLEKKNKKTSGKIRIFIDRKWWFVIDAEESSKNTKRER